MEIFQQYAIPTNVYQWGNFLLITFTTLAHTHSNDKLYFDVIFNTAIILKVQIVCKNCVLNKQDAHHIMAILLFCCCCCSCRFEEEERENIDFNEWLVQKWKSYPRMGQTCKLFSWPNVSVFRSYCIKERKEKYHENEQFSFMAHASALKKRRRQQKQ